MLVDVPALITAYYTLDPDPAEPAHRVSFGTSGHRGQALQHSFNEAHILAITQAVCDYRRSVGVDGPMFVGKDTHALSEPARVTTLEVLAANGVEVLAQDGAYTPTPVVSHAILTWNRYRRDRRADGIIITPSHNPPEHGGFKYNPPHGGPADARVTSVIQDRANELLMDGASIRRLTRKARAAQAHQHDFVTPYVADLDTIVDMAAIRDASLSIGVDPMGGSGVAYWAPIAERYGLNIEVVNPHVDPTFAFMRLDRDGVIRMDCSSPWSMASLIALKERFDVAFGNDPDYDRHGIVTPSGLMNPNHYLAVAIDYLFSNREWPAKARVGKTLVSSSMIDRVAKSRSLTLAEVPVGFKWFVSGLLSGDFGFGGEESAGASFLRRDGTVWTTDKDGIILDLLAAEITARTGREPAEHYRDLTRRFGEPIYERLQAPATGPQKAVLKKLSADDITASTLAGEPITATLTRAPGNDAPIGGLKVATENGWFAARPSGTEDIYKIYTESFLGKDHLAQIQEEAQAIVGAAFDAAHV